MRVSLTINTDNAAFSDEEGGWSLELAAILRQQAARVEGCVDPRELPEAVRDSNGNTVGGWHYRTGPTER